MAETQLHRYKDLYEQYKDLYEQKTKQRALADDWRNTPSDSSATTDVVTGNVYTQRDRCTECGKKFVKTDVALRTIVGAPLVTLLIHRRCLQAILDSGPEDKDVTAERVARARQELIDVGYESL